MANLTTVHVTAGIPDQGTGSVSTIDNLIVVGLPLTGGTVALGGGTTAVTGTTFVSGGTVTAQISGGTSFISGGNITAVISGTANLNQAGAALSSTNGIFANVLFNNALVSASVGLPVNLVSYAPLTAVISGTTVVSGTTFISGGTVTAQISGGTSFISGGNVTAVVSGTVTAVINIGGSANSSTNGEYANLLQNNATLTPTNGIWANMMFNNAIVSASVGLPVNIVSGTLTLGSIANTTFFSLQTGTWNNSIIQGGVALSSTNGIYTNLLQQNATLSPTNGLWGNVMFNNAIVSASVGLPVNLISSITITTVISGTAFVSGGTVTAQISGGTSFLSGGNITAAINQGGAALSSTNGIFANIILGNASISSTNPLMVDGETASGVTDANNPIKIGGLAKSAQITSVTDGQRVNAVFDLQGKQIVLQSIRALKANIFTTIATTGETVLISGLATTFQDVYGAICANNSGSTIQLTFKDSTGGNTQTILQVPSFDTRGFMVPESGAIKQTSQSTAWTVTPSLATSISITLLYVKNATA